MSGTVVAVRGRGAAERALVRMLNSVLQPIAATGIVGVWGVIKHRGRRSGREYRTPIALRATAGGFIIPLPYGSSTDWCRNVIAAGSATVIWRGAEHAVVSPRVVDRAVADPAFGPILRPALRLLRLTQFLSVDRAA